MPYKVKKTGATLKKVSTERHSNIDKDKMVPIYHETVYFEGDIIEDDDLAPVHIEEYDAEEGNIRELIERINTKKSAKTKQDK